MPPPSDPWYWAVLGSSYVSGALGWAGFALTLGGFVVALRRLSRVQEAATAAQNAALSMAKLVRSRELLLHLNSALATIESARGRLGSGTKDSACLFLDLSITSIIAARELAPTNDDTRRLRKLTVSLRKVAEQIDQMQEPLLEHNDLLSVVGDLRSQEEDIKGLSAKARYTYSSEKE